MTRSRLSIANKAYLGFTVIALLTGLLGVVAMLSANRARDNASSFHELNDKTFSIFELRAEVTELQRSVQLFASTGHESLADDATRRIATLRASLSDSIASPDALPVLERMQSSLSRYDDSLQMAVSERKLRSALVHRDLPALERRIATLTERRPESVDMETWARLVDARHRLRSNLFAYLYEPNYQLLTDATANLETVRPDVLATQAEPLAAALQDYAKIFTRVVQATRSYLYLVGVVMAGEAWEFSHLSEQLQAETVDSIPTAVAEMEQLATDIQLRTLLVGAAALGVALLLAAWLSRSISRPLAAMTSTLERVARGDHVDRVPGTERGDEIGVMAAAAEAFILANERTEALLKQQQSLTEELQQSRRDLERSNEELEQFVHTVSHDLKTPLVTSLGFIGMMREMAAAGQTELALSKLDILERSGKKMGQLITDLLDLSRVGRLETQLDLLDPDEVLQGVLAPLRARLEREACRVVIERPLPRVRANPTRLAQVFENLLTNALKYGRPRSGPFEVHVRGHRTDEGRTILTVADPGKGIPPEHHERVFGLFNRLSPEGEGTGIGLAIVHRVMHTSGGTVRVSSRGDWSGTTFELEFETGDEDHG